MSEDDQLLDDNTILVPNTQMPSPLTFSTQMVRRFRLKSFTNQRGDAANHNNNNTKAVSKYEFLNHCTAVDYIPKGVLPVVPLKIVDPPAQLKAKWNDTIVECGNKLMRILIDFHLELIKSREEMAQDTITRASQIILPEFVTDIPNIGDKIEEAIEDVVAETNRSTKKFPRKRKSNTTATNTPTPKKIKKAKNGQSSSTEEAQRKKTKTKSLTLHKKAKKD